MILQIARKDLKIVFRDRSALAFIFALPLVFVFIFGAAFGSSNDEQKPVTISVLVSNLDKGKHGTELIESMQALGLKTEIDSRGAGSVTERLKKGEKPLAILIPADFSEKLDAAAKAAIDREGTIVPVPLTALVDPAEPQVAGMAQGVLAGATRRITGVVFGKLIASRYGAAPNDSNTEVINLQIQRTNELAGATVKKPHSAGDNMIPGFAVYFVFFMANGVAGTLITEREQGTLRRMLSAPVTRFQVLGGKILARCVLGAMQTIVLFVVGVWLMKLHLSGVILSVSVIALATIFAATTLGMLIATMGKTLEQIQGMITLFMVVMGMISGCLVPRQLLPETLQKLSYVTPHAWALTAYQDILLRDRSLLQTLPNLAMVMVFGVGFLVLALRRFRYE